MEIKNTEDRDKGYRYIESKSSTFLLNMANFQGKNEDCFHRQYFSEEMRFGLDPLLWWQQASKFKITEDFMLLLKKLFALPASTGGIERSFSTLGNIMSKKRNRLDVEKAGKLCTVHNVLRNSEPSGRKGIKRKLT